MSLKKLLLLATCAVAVSCGGSYDAVETTPKNYKLLTVETKDTVVPSQFPASIRGVQYVDIRPQISGVITKVLYQEGANVKKGEALFVIDQIPYQAALDVAVANVKSAESSVATAKLNADSGEELFAEGVISENELLVLKNTLATAEAAYTLAEAQRKIAESNLSYTIVTSPVDGVAGMTDYHIGAYVSPTSDAMVSVTNNSDMYAYFSMSESQILALSREYGSAKGLASKLPKVELMLNDGELYELGGVVDAISGVVEQSTGSIGLRAKFSNPEMMLRDGGSGRVIIKTPHENVIVIPKVATYEIQNKTFVYKVIDGVAKSAMITINPNNDGYEYIVTSGIEVGDVIIGEGAGLVREGTVITNN